MRGAALAFLTEYAPDDERVDFARCGVLRDLAYLCPLGRCEVAIKTVEEHVQHLALVGVQLVRRVFAPEVRLVEYRRELRFR